MPDLTVSLIVPVYNAEKDLDHLFGSILRQSRPFDEVIFVDNGSRDASLEKLDAFRKTNSGMRTVVLTEAKKGPSAVRNAGIALCVASSTPSRKNSI